MRLLDRYLLWELLIPFSYCLGGFLLFWVSFDLISEFDEFQRYSLPPADIAAYYLVKTPELLVTVLPVALLLALLYALTNHARHHELTAIRAAGVSLWRISTPYLTVGTTLALALFALNEIWVPDANAAANRILTGRLPPTPGSLGPEWQPSLGFHNERGQRSWYIGAYNRTTGEMRDAHLDWRFPDGSRRLLTFDQGSFSNAVWVFHGVKELLYPAGSSLPSYRGETNQLSIPELSETPEQIESEIKFTDLTHVKAAKRPRLSLQEIRNYQRLHPHLDAANRAKLETQFHGRIAEPWKCLVVVLIALPFGAPSARRNVFVGVASSIFISFAYFIISSTTLALGTGGYVPAWLAAWLPNILFGTAGAFLTQRVR